MKFQFRKLKVEVMYKRNYRTEKQLGRAGKSKRTSETLQGPEQ
jgi:hypothetical protein